MTLIACHECGNSVSTEAASCPKCGAPISALISHRKRWGVGTWIAATAGVTFALVAIFIFPEARTVIADYNKAAAKAAAATSPWTYFEKQDPVTKVVTAYAGKHLSDKNLPGVFSTILWSCPNKKIENLNVEITTFRDDATKSSLAQVADADVKFRFDGVARSQSFGNLFDRKREYENSVVIYVTSFGFGAVVSDLVTSSRRRWPKPS
jgi:hypothetical protein